MARQRGVEEGRVEGTAPGEVDEDDDEEEKEDAEGNLSLIHI